MRHAAEPLPETLSLIAEILPQRRPAEMQTVYFQCMEDGPQKLAGADRGGVREPRPVAPCNDGRLMASVITAERIADLIEQAPVWALVGLALPQERLDARREVAEHVYSALYRPMDVATGQLTLPL